ncbi:MAG: TMAO reductase system periplasmic protein TorT [Ancylobacter novellus]|uniref:TMAO reductase system periplasmic protein TorT n=1 Tax=Ancylobacter novellus TaxID=921 RepID=A0A2W5R085_ANCNO|nr:MAG: TMAO reductase system periplasmic protein TorT [Ancylobacter novellus]
MRLRFSAALLCSVTGMLMPAHARDWFPVQVTQTTIEGGTRVEFTPVAKANKPWDVCASLPHVKDAYWVAVNYGLVEEARRLGVKLTVHEAGGYSNLNKQISQIEDCVVAGADAVLIGAISGAGLNNLIAEISSQGVIVIDFMNGVTSGKVQGRSLVSFDQMGHFAGKYLADKYPAGSGLAKVVWFPGPAGASWVESGNVGFQAAIKGAGIELLDTRYGDTGKEVQLKLVEDALQTYPDLDYIVGTAPTAEAAVQALQARGLQRKVKIISYYSTPEVLNLLRSGEIEAAPSDKPVVQARIALDLAVAALQGDSRLQHLGPVPEVITAETLNGFDAASTVAPNGFAPVFTVEP